MHPPLRAHPREEPVERLDPDVLEAALLTEPREVSTLGLHAPSIGAAMPAIRIALAERDAVGRLSSLPPPARDGRASVMGARGQAKREHLSA